MSGSNVTYSGTTIGTFAGGTDGSTPLVITFNASSTPTSAQALMRNITFENVSDAPSELNRTVRFVLTDGDGGTSNAATQTVVLTAVNDAPVLDDSQTPVLTTINEDPGVPSGAVGSLISELVDFASPAGQLDNVTDVDSGASLGIAITAADSTNGSWFYSIDNGANWNALGAVSDSNARLLAEDG